MKKILGLCMLTALLYGCSSVPITGRKRLMLVSNSEVLSSSLTEYSNYMKTAKVSTNTAGKAMVTRVGKRIATATEQYLRNNGMSKEIKDFAWEFNLVNSSEVNAFCMPGGKIVVYEGLLPLVSNDDDLAVVLGHEVAHAVAKHSNERMSQQIAAEYGATILDATLSNSSAIVQGLGSMVYGLGAQYGVMLPFSRKHESEADYMGLILMTMAGYNPNNAVTFWEKMSANGKGNAPQFLSTHPSDASRIKSIQKHLPEMSKYRPTGAGWKVSTTKDTTTKKTTQSTKSINVNSIKTTTTPKRNN
ncbi:M48 family metallopeptidase [Phocaeicola oris]|uniref:M48 family metallopeptidase n=1 Tax=Phocaeicola oris TaxID=2896850 RepID=UPI00234E39AB|nr:M48 family metallopeptidase [Phocaeicola oris]MCE2617388.1 M48 family metallopeptidase [Phocaeicola oris]